MKPLQTWLFPRISIRCCSKIVDQELLCSAGTSSRLTNHLTRNHALEPDWSEETRESLRKNFSNDLVEYRIVRRANSRLMSVRLLGLADESLNLLHSEAVRTGFSEIECGQHTKLAAEWHLFIIEKTISVLLRRRLAGGMRSPPIGMHRFSSKRLSSLKFVIPKLLWDQIDFHDFCQRHFARKINCSASCDAGSQAPARFLTAVSSVPLFGIAFV